MKRLTHLPQNIISNVHYIINGFGSGEHNLLPKPKRGRPHFYILYQASTVVRTKITIPYLYLNLLKGAYLLFSYPIRR